MPDVAMYYLWAALLVVGVLIVCIFLGSFLGEAGKRTRMVLQLAGMVMIATAVLEAVGWPVHPWQPGSPAAAIHDGIFRTLTLVGVGFVFVSWAMSFKVSGARSRSGQRAERSSSAPVVPLAFRSRE